jgi:hypothetical protein
MTGPKNAPGQGAGSEGCEHPVSERRDQLDTIGIEAVDERLEVVCGDASVADIGDADVVVAFLPVATVETLLPSLLGRLHAGARLVVHEQEPLGGAPADARAPLFSPSGISVAHRWAR